MTRAQLTQKSHNQEGKGHPSYSTDSYGGNQTFPVGVVVAGPFESVSTNPSSMYLLAGESIGFQTSTVNFVLRLRCSYFLKGDKD